ncbi:MAG: AAA family ATPase [Desulfurispora sp.]|uniref:AAA family ATPase n=1 Tax=Desulfurispora sp. TaxID=3014275 RepID=UPI004049B499
MRPLHLKICGLHSFSEPQEIDFRQLCAASLFGIFGPTGSGKSTILDAITLALYGKVDRAARGTQGIMHHAVDRLEVQFTFALGQGGEEAVYRVERVYKRTGEHTVQQQAARLVEVAGGVVLAEKTAVDDSVQQLLGLTHEDFTRAVVLPQGKFDEVLKKVRPADRFKMLERLFGLDEYGDKLKQKVERCLQQVQERYAAVRGELDGLGDASARALDQARTVLEQAQARESALAGQLAGMEQQEKEWAAVWQWQQELERVTAELARLEQQAARIEQLQRVLEAAGRADLVMTHGEEFQQASRAAREAEQALRLLQEQLPLFRRTLEEAEQATRRTAEERRRQEPVLLEQRSRLEQAGRLEQELAGLEAQGREHKQRLQKLEQEQKKLALQREEKSRRQEEMGRRLADCRRELGQVTLPYDLRQHLDEAWLLWQNCREAEERWSRAAKLSNNLQAGLDPARVAAGVAQQQLQEAEKTVQELEQALEEVRRADLAAELAAGLAEGRPCPVCGSVHHPAPALPVAGGGMMRLDERLAAARQSLEQARNREKEAASALAAVQARAEQAAAEESQAATALAGQKQQLKTALQVLGRLAADARAKGRVVADDFQRLCRQACEQPELVAELRRQVQEGERKKEELEKIRATLEEEYSTLERELTTGEEHLRELAVALTAGQATLGELRRQYRAVKEQLTELTGGRPVQELLPVVQKQMADLSAQEEETRRAAEEAAAALASREKELAVQQKEAELAAQRLERARQALKAALTASGFATLQQAQAAWLDEVRQAGYRREVEQYRQQRERLLGQQHSLQERLAGRRLAAAEWQRFGQELEKLRREYQSALQASAVAGEALKSIESAHTRWCELTAQLAELEKQRGRLEELKSLLRGNAFVQFVAQEQLVHIARAASIRLGQLTRYRYALEVTGEGSFIISDQANGGIKRPVSSLSGGETFLASLALALALSAQIQLKGRHPLEFFFLDEGFGTLDAGLLDTVVSTLEQLRLENLHIGLISHVPELQKRLPRRLLVHPPGPDGRGSRVELEVG